MTAGSIYTEALSNFFSCCSISQELAGMGGHSLQVGRRQACCNLTPDLCFQKDDFGAIYIYQQPFSLESTGDDVQFRNWVQKSLKGIFGTSPETVELELNKVQRNSLWGGCVPVEKVPASLESQACKLPNLELTITDPEKEAALLIETKTLAEVKLNNPLILLGNWLLTFKARASNVCSLINTLKASLSDCSCCK